MAQESILAVWKSDIRLGDEKLSSGSYSDALVYYHRARIKAKSDTSLLKKIAHCYYQLKAYPEAIQAYQDAEKLKHPLPPEALFEYAESLLTTSRYEEAIKQYQRLLKHDPQEWIQKKIWRIQNLQYLAEDSAHVAVRNLPFNTSHSEWGPVLHNNQLIFVSNKKNVGTIDRQNDALGFYKLFSTTLTTDPYDEIIAAARPIPFARELHAAHHTGPCYLYDGGHKLAFIASATTAGIDGARNLGLYFAERMNGKWQITEPFPHNASSWSISGFTINHAGDRIIFSSNAPYGWGGNDLYHTEKVNGSWTTPKNLGSNINSPKDEVFPYLHQDSVLYFSSNGHAGMGQLDLFKISFHPDSLHVHEPENLGYPLNSPFDDFSITLDSLGMHGFLASNRKAGGLDDDIYEFDINLEQYPLTLTAMLKYKEHRWSLSSDIKPWPQATVSLIDRTTGNTVYRTTSDDAGAITLVIPKFSYYIIEVEGENGKHKAAFELTKYKRDLGVPEIVFVKDLFD